MLRVGVGFSLFWFAVCCGKMANSTGYEWLDVDCYTFALLTSTTLCPTSLFVQAKDAPISVRLRLPCLRSKIWVRFAAAMRTAQMGNEHPGAHANACA